MKPRPLAVAGCCRGVVASDQTTDNQAWETGLEGCGGTK